MVIVLLLLVAVACSLATARHRVSATDAQPNPTHPTLQAC